MTPTDFTQEELAAIFFLAGSELSVIKADAEEGIEPDSAEVDVLLGIVNRVGPNVVENHQTITFDSVPAAEPEDDDDEDGGEQVGSDPLVRVL